MEELFRHVNKFSMKSRPSPVPYSYRPLYVISEIILIIAMCCTPRKGCSQEKIHIIFNAIRRHKEYLLIRDFLYQKKEAYLIIRYDPVVTRAIKFALAEELIYQQKNGLYKLTIKGKALEKEIQKNNSLFIKEKKILLDINTKLTEELIKGTLEEWRGKYVKAE